MSPMILSISYFRGEADKVTTHPHDYPGKRGRPGRCKVQGASRSPSLMTASSPVDHAMVTIRGKLGFMRLIRTRSVPVPDHPRIPVVAARPKDLASKNVSHGVGGATYLYFEDRPQGNTSPSTAAACILYLGSSLN